MYTCMNVCMFVMLMFVSMMCMHVCPCGHLLYLLSTQTSRSVSHYKTSVISISENDIRDKNPIVIVVDRIDIGHAVLGPLTQS